MEKQLKVIVGLGNPGREYKYTRHNLGFLSIDEAAKSLGIKVAQRKLRGVLGEGEVDNKRIVLAKPRTFMNLSGLSVKALMTKYRVKPGNILVVSDDFNLSFGTIRIRRNGSSGGHNGLASIIKEIGTSLFPRLRIGIGPMPNEVEPMKFVLENFTDEEAQKLPSILEAVNDALHLYVEKGIDAAMCSFNTRTETVEK